jgi:hypothetical protein
LLARHLEANGIPTAIIGSGMGVVEHCGKPRFLFSDFPLGNPREPPWHRDMQKAIVRQALEFLEIAQVPRSTVRAPYSWKEDDPDCRSRYGRVDPAERERLPAIGEERRRQGAERATRHGER